MRGRDKLRQGGTHLPPWGGAVLEREAAVPTGLDKDLEGVDGQVTATAEMQWLVPPGMVLRPALQASTVANRAYMGLAVLTLIVQVWIRLQHCSGMAGCALSVAKAPLWAAFWPLFWPIYFGAMP